MRARLTVAVAFGLLLAACTPEPSEVPSPARSWSGASGPRADLVEPPAPPTTPAPERDVRMGEPAKVGDWMIRVIGVELDATDAVLAENQFNSPPPPLSRFTMVTLEASYVGGPPAAFWFGSELRLVDDDGAHTTFDPSCGVIPDDLAFGSEVFPGGTVTGNVCWVVADRGGGPITMTARDPFDLEAPTVTFVIDADAPIVAGTTTPDPLPPLELPVARVGEAVDLGGWRIAVVDHVADATGVVMAENQFNDPPLQGESFTMIRLRVERIADTPGSLFSELTASVVGSSRVARSPFTSSCGVIPDPLTDLPEAVQGTVLEGNLCWAVESGDVEGLVLFLTEFASGERVYLSVSRT